MKLTVVERERTFEKVTRDCPVCAKKYEVFAFFGDESFTSCFECVKCHDLLWYDFYTDKYFDELAKKIKDSKQVWLRIESELPLCKKCGGKYKRADWVVYGAPEHCTHCHVSQRTNGIPLSKDILKAEGKVRNSTEKVAFVVSHDNSTAKI